jgi:hypothetical protein
LICFNLWVKYFELTICHVIRTARIIYCSTISISGMLLSQATTRWHCVLGLKKRQGKKPHKTEHPFSSNSLAQWGLHFSKGHSCHFWARKLNKCVYFLVKYAPNTALI